MPSAQTRSPSVCAASTTSCTSTASWRLGGDPADQRAVDLDGLRAAGCAAASARSGRCRSRRARTGRRARAPAAATAAASATSVTIAVSVISRQSRSGAQPAVAERDRSRRRRTIGSRSWTGETLTDMTSGWSCTPDQDAACRQARSSTQRPSSTISPVDSASGMNIVRRYGAELGVVPAGERLDADDRAVGEVDDRLVVHLQAAGPQRPAQPVLEVVGSSPRRVVEGGDPVARGPVGLHAPRMDQWSPRLVVLPDWSRLPGQGADTPLVHVALTAATVRCGRRPRTPPPRAASR